jgi:ATP-dependent helicase/nuclease subunit B
LPAALDAGETVLAPNKELADALIDAVERRHRDAGEEIWPTPRVRDFSSWLREQHSRKQILNAGNDRCLSEFEELEIWRGVVEEGKSGEDFLDTQGAARSARRARRAMHEYGIPARAVAQYGTDESHALLDWIDRFAERCRQLGCISADELLGIMAAPEERIAWIESPNWRPAALRWLRLHGREIAAPSLSSRDPCRLFHAATPEVELAAVAEWAEANARSREFRAWVCVPDLSLRRDEVIDAFDALLTPHGAVPYAVAGGTPLMDYAPVRAALDTLDAVGAAVSFEQFSALLRMPELQASAAEAARAASLDVELRARAPGEARLEDWIAISDRAARAEGTVLPAALQRLRASLQALTAVRGREPISRWVAIWMAAIEAGPWSLRHRWSSIEYQAAKRFAELMASLACADSLFGAQSRQAAQGILTRAAREAAFQPQTGVTPIWVSGQLIDPWLSYDGIWVTGCSEERWPEPADPIPLLPVKLQREYGVIGAGAESQLQLAEDLQQRWLRRAAACIFSYANPGDGRTAAPSPLLPEGVEALRSDQPAPRPHWRQQADAAPALERLNDELAPPFAGDERTRGTSTLRAQSQCAFRGFAQSRLGTWELELPEPGFNARQRGELLHQALEGIWSELRDSEALASISAQAQAALVNDCVSRAIVAICRRRDPGARWRMREQVRMQGVLCKWLDVERERASFTIETLEGAQTARLGGLDFTVRIDRADRLADGARVLIDYKSGGAAYDWRGERPDNPQLTIYALLQPQSLIAVAYGRVNARDCGFLAESERSGVFAPGKKPTALEGSANFAQLIGVWSGRIEKLAADFAAGHAEVAPTLTACRTCSLHALCRVPAPLDDEEGDPRE